MGGYGRLVAVLEFIESGVWVRAGVYVALVAWLLLFVLFYLSLAGANGD